MATDDQGEERVAGSSGYALRYIQDLTQSRQHGEALDAARALLARAPYLRDALYFTAVNQRRLGKIRDASLTLNVLERAHPHFGSGYQERGACLIALGDAAGAIAAFERAVTLNPTLASSWERLERLHAAAGEPGKAAVAAQQRAMLNELPTEIVEAGGLFCDGEFAAAEKLLMDFVGSEGRHVEASRLLGRIAQRRGALERAETLFNDAVALAPVNAAARLDLALVLIERQKYPAALKAVDEALRTAPANSETRFLRATILASLARHDEAVAMFRQLIAEAPENNPLRIVLGHSLKASGRAPEAIAAYREAAQGATHIGDAYWSLANLKTYRFSDAEVERMRVLEARPRAGLPDRAELCFALAKALEDRADYRESWAFYQRANVWARSKRRYLPEASEDYGRRLIGTCGSDFFAARAGVGAPDRDALFIVGLPRSGSTLLEQILASHPDIDATQELYDIPRIVAEFNGPGEARYPELLKDLDSLAFERLGRRYLDEVSAYRRGRPRFLDKMPNNFWHVGLIHLMFPNAKILDVRRHPMAACVSNYKQFYAKGQDFSYSIEDVARYYRAYLNLMRHWSEALPGRVLTIVYEDLVEDLEGGVRRALAHCELEFDPACLKFHTSRRVVSTPSSEQVRQPLFRDGLSAWRNFEPWLEPLKTALGDALQRWDEA